MVKLEEVIGKITKEQEALESKKQEVKKLVEFLQSKLDETKGKSYRQISQHLQGEVIKALVSAHDLEIKISNNLLRAYESLAKLLKEEASESMITGDLLAELVNAMQIADMDNDQQPKKSPNIIALEAKDEQ